MSEVLILFGHNPRMLFQFKWLNQLINAQLANGLQISLVLIHDGVIGAYNKSKNSEEFMSSLDIGVEFYAMILDLKARGIPLNGISEKIKPIEYTELVDLLDNTRKVISWM